MVGTAAMDDPFASSDLMGDGVSAIAKLARRVRVHGLTRCCFPSKINLIRISHRCNAVVSS